METKKLKNKSVIYIALSFVIASLIMFLVYVFNGMIFGEYIPMRSDFLQGYIPIFKNTAREILNGNNILFSFSSCLGLNNIFYLANIIFSPFNILYLLLFNVDDNIVTVIIVVLKVGLISSSFNYFSNKILNNNRFSSVIISCFYALCSYTLAYGTVAIMWLDAMFILPLLTVAIVKNFKEHKRVFLIILYTYLFISQFYIAYMVGIFSLVVVILYAFVLYDNETKHSIKDKINRLFDWVLCVVISVLLSAFVWVPTLFFILGNRADDSSSILNITASLLQILNSFFWGMGYNITGTFGYLYCGIPALLSAPLFFTSKDINKKEKYFSAFVLGIYLLSMVSTHINLFLHVFDQPDFFFYRYSFVISFAVCSICARYLAVEKSFSIKRIVVTFVSLMLFYLLMQQTAPVWNLVAVLNPYLNDNVGFFVNLLLLSFWIAAFWLYYTKKLNGVILACVCIVVAGAEIVSGSVRVFQSPTTKEEYYPWFSFMNETVNEIKNSDSDFYRIVVTNDEMDNSDSYFSFNGISEFGDQEKMKVRHFLSNIGFATSPRYIDDSGYNDVSNMILGVKYNIVLPYKTFEFEENEEIGEGYYLKNDNFLGLGYLVNGDVLLEDFSNRNVFENLNSITESMSGVSKDCFVRVPSSNISYDELGVEFDSYNGTNKFHLTSEEGSFYITVKNEGYEDAYLQVEVGKPAYDLVDFLVVGAKNTGHFLNVPARLSTANKMYYNAEKDKFTIAIYARSDVSPEYLEFDKLNVYFLDKDALREHYDSLSNGQLVIEEWENGYIKGNLHVEGDRRLLFTSIPYDPGWTVKVNGQISEITTVFDGAFLGVLLPSEGDYELEFSYEMPGLKIGIMTSILGILAFFAVVFENKLKKHKN